MLDLLFCELIQDILVLLFQLRYLFDELVDVGLLTADGKIFPLVFLLELRIFNNELLHLLSH